MHDQIFLQFAYLIATQYISFENSRVIYVNWK